MNVVEMNRARAAVTAGPTVDFTGENNMDKRTEAGAKAQGKRRNVIPATFPKLVASLSGTFLVYSGMRLPITTEQAICHVIWLQQHLRDAALAEQMGQGVAHG
ncbi:hypothetical protein [Aeromonas caviae]|jgi:hypothetical protein|uniref:hypothetical protein n=1 Tax=Aeromonas caviae TaxID=648 RepID=UPI001CC7F42F|nr:hypothetical protein [Aeromonas caviae]